VHSNPDQIASNIPPEMDLGTDEHFDYQKIFLPDGSATQGHDRTATAELIFGSDLKNKSVLDVGCSLGFFCFEAEKRGASRVVGIDVHPGSIEKAKKIASIIGSKVNFLVGNL